MPQIYNYLIDVPSLSKNFFFEVADLSLEGKATTVQVLHVHANLYADIYFAVCLLI